MYEIKKTPYGIHVTMGGLYEENEIEEYIAEKENLLSEIDGSYSMIIDLRTAIPPKHEDAQRLKESQEKMKDSKMHRMAIIVSSPVIMNQAKQISFLSELDSSTKYIDSSKTDNWEEVALQWISESSKVKH
ncbi:MAG: hypothetical protein V3S17_04640 [candidate division Zixibacteria bacterium]